jgi:hypothetical protein
MNDLEALSSANVGCASADDAEALAGIAARAEREYAVAANPVNRPDIHELFARVYSTRNKRDIRLTLADLSLTRQDIFSSSAKTAKSEYWGYWTPALYLASGEVAEAGVDLCPYASEGCRLNCLLVSGQREMKAHTALEVSERLRSGGQLGDPTVLSLLRTYAYMFAHDEFMGALREQIQAEYEHATKNSLYFAVRLNATSDLPWENSGIMEEFSDVPFYDYTKIPSRAMRYAASEAPGYFKGMPYHEYRDVASNPPWPKNYYLNFSYSEVNLAWCLILLNMGVNVVVPFTSTLGREPWEFDHTVTKPILPEQFLGRPVIDGDAYDIRFIDNDYWGKRLHAKPPFIVGLRVKGNYQKRNAEQNSFFFDAQAAQALGNDPSFIAGHVYQNTQEALRQAADGKGLKAQVPPLKLAEQHLHPEVFDALKSALE